MKLAFQKASSDHVIGQRAQMNDVAARHFDGVVVNYEANSASGIEIGSLQQKGDKKLKACFKTITPAKSFDFLRHGRARFYYQGPAWFIPLILCFGMHFSSPLSVWPSGFRISH
jgi:hypothetical protein